MNTRVLLVAAVVLAGGKLAWPQADRALERDLSDHYVGRGFSTEAMPNSEPVEIEIRTETSFCLS